MCVTNIWQCCALLAWCHFAGYGGQLPGQQQNVNEEALNEPALAALSLLAGRDNMFPVGVQPQIHGQTMSLAIRLDKLAPLGPRDKIMNGHGGYFLGQKFQKGN